MTARVLIGSPTPLVRDVLDLALADRGLEVVARADDPKDLLAAARRDTPDVVVTADQYGDADLVDYLPHLLSSGRGILVVQESASSAHAFDLLMAGATGCLGLAVASTEELADAAEAVARGQVALHHGVAAVVLAQWRALRDDTSAPPEPPVSVTAALTGRERDVLVALANGLSTRESAKQLGVSPRTIEAHRTRLFSKLGARNQANAISLARERGWLE